MSNAAICAICNVNEDARPICEDLQSISACGHARLPCALVKANLQSAEKAGAASAVAKRELSQCRQGLMRVQEVVHSESLRSRSV